LTKETLPADSSIRLWRFRFVFGVAAVLFAIFIVCIILLANHDELRHRIEFFISFRHADKVWHFLLMGVMSLLLNLALTARQIRIGPAKILLGSLIVAVLATGEELSQGFLKTRTMDVFDWLADMAGIVMFGWIAAMLVRRFFQQNK